MNNLILNPEYQNLIKEIEELKIQISTLIEERDQLLYHDCKIIKAEYMSKIGVLEYKVYEFQIKYLRLKRKIELYQIHINRQESIDEKAVENQLETEYKEYQKKIKEMSEEVQESLATLNNKNLSKDDAIEIKKLYRTLIKKLHPDLNPNYNERTKQLLLQVEQAYKNGDLQSIKSIDLLTDDITEETIELGEFDELKNKKEKLLEIIKNLNSSIEKIKTSFPYNQINFLNDNEKISIKQKELNSTLDEYKLAYKALEEQLTQMKGDLK